MEQILGMLLLVVNVGFALVIVSYLAYLEDNKSDNWWLEFVEHNAACIVVKWMFFLSILSQIIVTALLIVGCNTAELLSTELGMLGFNMLVAIVFCLPTEIVNLRQMQNRL